MSQPPAVSCRELVIGFPNVPLLPAFDLELCGGELVLVVGRNGTGKSTWLRTLLGMQPPLAGEIQWRTPRPRLAYVPQDAGLDPILPVRGSDVAGWGRLRGWSFLRPVLSNADRRARELALAEAEAVSFAGGRFELLSGGQKQRILFARLLASDAEFVLVDEPTASMDAVAEKQTYEKLAALAHERGAAVVVVTHTISVAVRLADRVVFFERSGPRGEGVVTSGSPAEVFAHPLFERHFGVPELADAR
jgi:zinc transport system ATP-binding protein